MDDALKDALSGLIAEVTPPLARRLGEPEETIQRGLHMSATELINNIVRRADNSEVLDKMLELTALAAQTTASVDAATYLATTTGGESLVSAVFGPNRANVIKKIAQSEGLRESTAGCVLESAAALLLLDALRSETHEADFGVASPSGRSDKEASDFAPAHLASYEELSQPGHEAAAKTNWSARSLALLLSLLLAVALVGGIRWFSGRNAGPESETAVLPATPASPPVSEAPSTSAKEEDSTPTPDEPATAPKESASKPIEGLLASPEQKAAPAPARDAIATSIEEAATTAATEKENTAKSTVRASDALGRSVKKKLPNGVELTIPQLGVETKLLAFIEGTSKPANAKSFDLDRIVFDAGKATLQPSSQEQLQNIAKIMKAYPGVNARIGGHTDNVGDKTFNLKLSSGRANNVLHELTRIGVDKSRMTAQGYGQDHPIASNGSEEGRAQNRRISLSVTQK